MIVYLPKTIPQGERDENDLGFFSEEVNDTMRPANSRAHFPLPSVISDGLVGRSDSFLHMGFPTSMPESLQTWGASSRLVDTQSLRMSRDNEASCSFGINIPRRLRIEMPRLMSLWTRPEGSEREYNLESYVLYRRLVVFERNLPIPSTFHELNALVNENTSPENLSNQTTLEFVECEQAVFNEVIYRAQIAQYSSSRLNPFVLFVRLFRRSPTPGSWLMATSLDWVNVVLRPGNNLVNLLTPFADMFDFPLPVEGSPPVADFSPVAGAQLIMRTSAPFGHETIDKRVGLGLGVRTSRFDPFWLFNDFVYRPAGGDPGLFVEDPSAIHPVIWRIAQ